MGSSASGEKVRNETQSGGDGANTSAEQEPCEKCTELFYAELDKSMKATAKAYFGWVSRILSSAPLEHQKPWWQKALMCGDGGGGGGGKLRGQSPRTSSCPGGMSFSSSKAYISKAFGVASEKLGAEPGHDYAPDLSGAEIDIQTEAKECLHWIELNSTALRKILKKWDKTNHSTKGRNTLRKYWSDSKYQMLYSPLILELRAVAGMLHGGEEGPHWEDDDLQFNAGVMAGSDSSDSLGGPAVGEEASHSPDLLKCSICLDTLYKPVGLACGHVFCRDCLLQTAGILKEGATFADLRTDPTMVQDEFVDEESVGPSGLSAASGAAGSMPGQAAGDAPGAGGAEAQPARTTAPPRRRRVQVRKDRCPECRHDDVFATSVRLRHVQECLRQVDPEGYKIRKAESKQFRRALEKDAAMESIVKMLLKVATPSGMN